MLKGKKFDAFTLFKGSERTFKGSERTFKGSERNFQRLKRTFTLWTSKNSMIRTS